MLFSLLLVVAVSALANAQIDKTMAALDAVQLAQCRAGIKGEHPKSILDAVSECKKDEIKKKESDACHTLCLWHKFNYFDKDASGKVTGINKANVDKISNELYTDPKSISGKTQDLMSCYESVKPVSQFKMEGKCEDFAPLNKCYKQKMLEACVDYLKNTKDFD